MALRLGILIVLGIVHQFLQTGEALLFYGVLGFALLPFYKPSPKIVAGMGLILLPLGIVLNELLMILSMFYLGMFTGKIDYLTNLSRYRKETRILWMVSILLSVPALLAQMYLPRLVQMYWTGNPFTIGARQSFAGIIIAAAVVTSLSLWLKAERLLGWLAPFGRMALTNYLMHTVLVLLIALAADGYGTLNYRAVPFIQLAILPIQILLSNLWLHRFAYGQLEWLWRLGICLRTPPYTHRTEDQPG